jgi:hypothetical protein
MSKLRPALCRLVQHFSMCREARGGFEPRCAHPMLVRRLYPRPLLRPCLDAYSHDSPGFMLIPPGNYQQQPASPPGGWSPGRDLGRSASAHRCTPGRSGGVGGWWRVRIPCRWGKWCLNGCRMGRQLGGMGFQCQNAPGANCAGWWIRSVAPVGCTSPPSPPSRNHIPGRVMPATDPPTNLPPSWC